MSDITIVGKVTDENGQEVEILITDYEIEKMIIDKAEAIGIKGYKGKLWEHYNERVISVSVYNL